MQHNIPLDQLGPQGGAMAHAVEKCVHCGFCLAACPTYKVLGEEMDSPRGRIFLMKEVLEGNLDQAEAAPYIDRCLGCEACVPACPSGVEYAELLIPYRAHTEPQRTRSPLDRLARQMVLQTLPFPNTFRAAIRTGKLAKPFQPLLPAQMRGMLDLLPAELPPAQPLPEIYPAKGERRAQVALLAGCAQQVLAPEINWATLRVLAENGVETVIPKHQNCCGSLSLHTGAAGQAKVLARHNLNVFPTDVDAVITNAAGCGSGMKEYPLLFKDSPDEARATAFAAQVKDVSEFLDDLGLFTPPALPTAIRAAYHDACHLAHAQGITAPPRRLLASIPNLTLLEVPEGDICCGSAGTYNLEQPELARQLGRRKAQHLLSTGAEVVVTGNIGCMTQIQTHLAQPLPVYHTMELLDQAYGNAS
ncbi:MAG: glycolate oxidase subunit GlcF [Anaerolineae bacterium]|nr:glycolate oxidase subunit GlcF [Anaerolineae bacterium]